MPHALQGRCQIRPTLASGRHYFRNLRESVCLDRNGRN